MAWTIDYTSDALNDLARLDRTVAGRIVKFTDNRLSVLADQKTLGRKLEGDKFDGVYRWRVGDCRILGIIDGHTVHILIVAIGHRSKIYKRSPAS